MWVSFLLSDAGHTALLLMLGIGTIVTPEHLPHNHTILGSAGVLAIGCGILLPCAEERGIGLFAGDYGKKKETP